MSKPCFVLAILVLMMIICSYEAREFVVGGKDMLWRIPASHDMFNKWAENNRFQIGDSIIMKYEQKADSVVEVTEMNYRSCNKSNPIKSHDDGNTKITFERSGPYFFISGNEAHCIAGQKVEIIVLSTTHHKHASAPSPSYHHDHLAPSPAKNGGSSLKSRFVGGSVATVMGILALV